jgi:hypothetical protein
MPASNRNTHDAEIEWHGSHLDERQPVFRRRTGTLQAKPAVTVAPIVAPPPKNRSIRVPLLAGIAAVLVTVLKVDFRL